MQPITLMPKRNDISGKWEYELVHEVEVPFGNDLIIVPKYFSYDGASIPSVAWSAVYTPFNPIVMGPALVHDWLYSNHQTTRDEADKLFRDLLKSNRVPQVKWQLMYKAVAKAGAPFWKNKKTDIKYLVALYNKLRTEGHNVNRYKFPVEVIEEAK